VVREAVTSGEGATQAAPSIDASIRDTGLPVKRSRQTMWCGAPLAVGLFQNLQKDKNEFLYFCRDKQFARNFLSNYYQHELVKRKRYSKDSQYRTN
jgi:hypothetical protein